MTQRLLVSLLLTATVAVMATGCVGPMPSPGSPAPERFSLQLRRRTHDGRLTYFELAPTGELSFGGGRDAALWVAQPVTTLTPAQRQQAWDIITTHGLLAAKGSGLRSGQQVTYDFAIATDKGPRRSFQAADDEVPGLAELHDLLFAIQGEVRYQRP